MSAQANTQFDYVAVGHVTVDLIGAERARQPGGGAFYSGLQAARLGLRTLIVTQGDPTELRELLTPYAAEFEVQILPSAQTTTLLTTGDGATRSQRLLAWAGPMRDDISIDTAILHLAPVARETPARWRGHAGFVGITPQGLVREWDGTGTISHIPLAPSSLPERLDAVVISQVELANCAWLLSPEPAPGSPTPAAPESSSPGPRSPEPSRPLVVVTAGSEPIAIHSPAGSLAHAPALTVEHPQDDLGAGDVFAAALFVALAEGQSTTEAVSYASAAAAARLGGVGASAIGGRDAVSQRLKSDRGSRSAPGR
jgi:sugar/nucleoside kinase (ribokinase family)